ncbi:MAG: DUF362 domain-containing protein [Lentisphaeria bacterium]|nr:DUF362 domain-containing protein [Lentisphaeria bacterium]
MRSTVYFVPLSAHSEAGERAAAGRRALAELLKPCPVSGAELPLKLHFGERGNRTYLAPELYDGMIDLLEERGVKVFFTETSVLYGGERFEAARHVELARKHGFTRLPVVIADGDHGEAARDVPVVNGKMFRTAAVARILADAEQVLVVSHFKGHMLAGFGGAIKQLSMGFAAKGGKMAMHLGVKPRIRGWKCRACGLCARRCNEGAITKRKKYHIDHDKCVGCGACFSICPHHAVSVVTWAGLKNALFGGRVFRRKLVEYAMAAHHGKRNLYVTFAVNVTPGCDCEPRPMGRCVDDIGVFASLDPVALDAACYDAVSAAGKRFRGYEQLEYAETIGLGTREYEVVAL